MIPVDMPSYKQLLVDETDVHAEQPKNRISLRKAVLLLSLATIATFSTVFSAVGAALERQAHLGIYSVAGDTMPDRARSFDSQIDPGSEARHTSCGRSPEEARSRGCKFDISSFAWLTPECYDEELTQEFVQWSNWTWYLREEPDELDQIGYEQAQLGETNTFVDWKYHMTHCTFMWRLQHRSIEKGWVGRHLVHYNHTIHCQHALLMDGDGHGGLRTPARIVYPPCLKIGVEELMYPGLTDRAGISW